MDPLDVFYTDHPFVDWHKPTWDEGHSQYFSNKIVFRPWWLPILKCSFTKICCAKD